MILASNLGNTKHLQMKGFIDDNPALRGKHVFGYPIYGRESAIPTIVTVHGITEIWVSFVPDNNKRARLKSICSQCDIELVIIPEMEPFSRYSQQFFAKSKINLDNVWFMDEVIHLKL